MMRLIIVLAVMAVIDIYSFQALKEWVRPFSPGARRISYGIYWAFTALAILYLLINVFEWNESWSKSLKTLGRAFVFLVYVCKLPIVGLLLIDDLRRGITYIINQVSPTANYNVSRSRFLSSMGLLMGGIPFATLTYGIVRNQYRFKRYAADVPVKDLPQELDGLKIVQISDMHSGSWTRIEPLQRAVDMINDEAADLVCFTGDIVNDKAEEMEPFIDVFKQIRAKHGVYSVLGNHDYGDYVQWKDNAAKEANMEQLYGVHRRLGWDLLRDEHRLIDINGRSFGVLGVENWSAKRFGKRGNLKKHMRVRR